jgi:soluble lytic murein transglycosylase-like protein
MCLYRAIGVFLLGAAAAVGADTSSYDDAVRRAYTVAVDGRSGRLVRVPVKTATPEKVARGEARPTAPLAAPLAKEPLEQAIDRAAEDQGIHPSFVHAVIRAESNYNPGAISPKGAQGLMQLMPQTARRFGVKNSFDPLDNLQGGVRYLRFLLDTYGDAGLTLAAYNAGEGAVDRYRGVPPYSETREFVRRVNRFYGSKREQASVRTTPAAAAKKMEGPQIYWYRDGAGNVHYTTAAQ